MRERLQRRLHASGNDAGITLVELLVVGAISSILLSAVGITFTSTLKASRSASARVSATAEARVAMEVVTSRLRVAVRPPDPDLTDSIEPYPSILTLARRDSLEFFASLSSGTADPAPSRVQYWVERVGESMYGSPQGTQNCLRERVRPFDALGPGPVPDSAAPGRCIAFGIISPTLFSYYTGVPQPTQATPTPTVTQPTLLVPPAGGGLLQAEANSVQSVQIDLALRDRTQPGSAPSLTSTRILLINRLNEDLA